jgi:peptidoglycan/LPS O-acetylase OafA/YrhL
LALLGCLVVIGSAFWLPEGPWSRLLIGSGATLLLCLAVMALEQTVLLRPGLRWIAGLGGASMAIYLSHTIFSAAARIGLQQVGVTDVAVHMVVGTLVGLLCPVVLYGVARRWGLTAKLGF